MCGIAGIARPEPAGVEPRQLLRMAAAIRHRGPDGYGIFAGARVGLAHTRLSIIDPAGGAQPMTGQDGRHVVVFNGEIFNYRELRSELRSRGHRFRTSSDTEVLLEAYAEWGIECLARLNGQFAFALLDRDDGSVFLARDRFGIRPLHFAVRGGTLYFGSEVKAILASGEVTAALDLDGLDQILSFWATVSPRTAFVGIQSLPPGHFLVWRDGEVREGEYYHPTYAEAEAESPTALEELDALLRDSVALQMRADVPVGAYLSGGLDSAATAALARGLSHRLQTFSIAFEDGSLDESVHQQRMARALGTDHVARLIAASDVGRVFPDVIRHAETPLVRTAPAPMLLLSRLTRDHGTKVVLTGEGADELFLGYDLFKEVAVRRFCLRRPESPRRPLLFDRLYPYLGAGRGGGEFWRRFFLDASDADDPLFSHMPRILLTSWTREFYTPALRLARPEPHALELMRERIAWATAGLSPLNRAAYLELMVLLPGYLLSSQGDRMAMASGVEGRYPFLDHRLFELTARLPVRSRLRGLREKDILRRWAREVVPPVIAGRPKQPYRAPDAPAFFGPDAPDYVDELLSDGAVRDTGIFAPEKVAGLVRRGRAGRISGFRESQALVSILSTQLWHREFVSAGRGPAPLPLEGADVVMDELTTVQ